MTAAVFLFIEGFLYGLFLLCGFICCLFVGFILNTI